MGRHSNSGASLFSPTASWIFPDLSPPHEGIQKRCVHKPNILVMEFLWSQALEEPHTNCKVVLYYVFSWCTCVHTSYQLHPKRGERELLYMSAPSSIQHESPEIACSPEVVFFNWFYAIISFKGPELDYSWSFEMNLQQTYRRPSFNVGWMSTKWYALSAKEDIMLMQTGINWRKPWV